MILLNNRARALAAGLAALAGFVDAIGFLGMGGFFVSFMSGNSTRIGVGVASETEAVGVAAGLVLAFVVGVTTGSLVARIAGRWRKPAVLALVATALGLAGALYQPADIPGAFLLVAFAMGAENMVFQRDSDVAFGLTYMTGTLVKIGHRLADALSGGPYWHWLPWLALWAGLVCGGIAGAISWLQFGAISLWIAAVLAGILSIASSHVGDEPVRRSPD
ncbi:MAG: YoaK family protein [Sandaracinobacteroides sp.]